MWSCEAAVLTGFAELGGGGPDGLEGDYAGWAYGREVGDFPVRLHCRADEIGLRVTLDAPAQSAFDLPVENVRATEQGLSFDRVNSQGRRWRYELRRKGDWLEGEANLEDEDTCAVEFRRSDESIIALDPVGYADCAGIYGDEANGSLIVSSWFWGELRLFDLQTGADRTLFPTGPDSFFHGPAQYVPAPVEARLTFRRGPDGHVTGVEHRAGDRARVLPRRHIIEEPVAFASPGAELRGTLFKPAGAGPYPAVVVLGGSSWQIRGQLRRDADAFVALGLAALVFDHRGFGESGGGANCDAICRFDDVAADAQAAVEFLANHPGIARRRIGIFGRSRSGWTAPLAASRCNDVSFLILFVPPSISPAAQETTRRTNELRRQGLTDGELADASSYLELLFRCTRSDADWERYEAARSRIVDKGWVSSAGVIESRDGDDYRWSALNMEYDPLPALRAVTCPVLALFGENDDNVVPGENLPPMEGALRAGENRDFTLTIVPERRWARRGGGPSGAARRMGPSVTPTWSCWRA